MAFDMLIRFTVGNFLSFDEIQEFSMISGHTRGKMEHVLAGEQLKLLKFAAIYGANASGKSNLISAVEFARKTILADFPEGHTRRYHRSCEKNRYKPSYFEFEITWKGQYFAYGFEAVLNQSRIISEWLVEMLPDGTERQIFSRDTEAGRFAMDSYFTDPALLNKLHVYADDIKLDGSVLFLRLMNTNKEHFYTDYPSAAVLRSVFSWIKYKLAVNDPNQTVTEYSDYLTEENLSEISSLLASFGTGVTDLHFTEVSPDRVFRQLPEHVAAGVSAKLEARGVRDRETGGILLRGGDKNYYMLRLCGGRLSCRTLELDHSGGTAPFRMAEESDGTVRILDLIEILLRKSDEKVYFIDEIDRCLHPQLTYKFIETFFKLAAGRNTQLIVTTHESRLMNFDLLRRDEVWFVEKNSAGASTLYSLEEYNERFDSRVDQAYLEGRYGGVPVFGPLNGILPEEARPAGCDTAEPSEEQP